MSGSYAIIQKKETGKQYLSVWVPAAALNYMLDVDGSHDPEIIGKVLEELKQAEDAVLLDTSELDFEQSLAAMKKIIAEKVNKTIK